MLTKQKRPPIEQFLLYSNRFIVIDTLP
jgi:hypothetical protein